MLNEFVEFVRKYGVFGLAIAFVTGTAASSFVKIISDNLLSPIVGLIISLFGKDAFARLNVHIADGVEFGFGYIIYGLINFLAVMLFVFLLVKNFGQLFLTEEEKKKI